MPTDESYDLATGKYFERSAVDNALALMPEAPEAPVTVADAGVVFDSVSQALSSATDERIATAANGAASAAYTSLRNALTEMRNMLQSEFEAI